MPTMQFDYSQIEPRIREALYSDLGQHIAIGTEEVDDGRVFVKVVSPQFNGMSAKARQDKVWSALRTLGADAQAVSLVLTFGTDEI